MRDATLLSIVARINPAAWDAIIPHSHKIRVRADLAALNPQLLPPAETFLVAAAEMAHELVRMAVETEVGGGSAGFVSEFIEDWCGTPWPRKWPWPGAGPRPDEVTLTELWDVRTARVAGAIVFASAGSRLSEGELGEAFAKGAERLAEVAVIG